MRWVGGCWVLLLVFVCNIYMGVCADPEVVDEVGTAYCLSV